MVLLFRLFVALRLQSLSSVVVFFVKQKTAYEMRISDWSSDVCSSDLFTNMFDLTGMTALVTGASGGIGSAIAQALAAQGARLAVSGSNADKLSAFRDTLGGDHVALPCNLGDAAAVDALVPSAVEALGQLDILVNNAGVPRDNLIMRMKDEEWMDVIRINLEANFRLARAAAKPMMKARFGRIISITSAVRAPGHPAKANYAT